MPVLLPESFQLGVIAVVALHVLLYQSLYSHIKLLQRYTTICTSTNTSPSFLTNVRIRKDHSSQNTRAIYIHTQTQN